MRRKIAGIAAIVVVAILVGFASGWFAFQALDGRGQSLRVAAAAVAGVLLPSLSAAPIGFQIWSGRREEGRATRRDQQSMLDRRIELVDELAKLEAGATRDGQPAAGSRSAQRVTAREEALEHLDGLLAQDQVLARAPRGAISTPEARETQLSGDEVAELRDLLARSASVTEELDAQGWFLRGNAAYEAGDYIAALAAYERSVDLGPDHKEAHFNQGAVLGQLGRHDEALTAFDRAIELGPDYPEAHHNRGVALGRLGRHAESLVAYERAIELDPNDPEAHLGQGATLLRLERSEEALAAFDRAIELKPDYSAAHHDRGVALGRLQRDDEEFAAYDRAIELDPSDPDPHYNRGIALSQLKRYDEALAAQDRAIELTADHASAHYNRACALSQLGRNADAMDSLVASLDAGFSDCDLLHADDELQPLRDDPAVAARFAELIERCRSQAAKEDAPRGR